MPSLTNLIKTLVRSRLGWTFCILHAALFFYVIFEKPPAPSPSEVLPGMYLAGVSYFAGRYYHFTYESILYQIITITDLPAICILLLLGMGVSLLAKLMGLSFSEHTASWLAALSVLGVASLQWLVVGYWIESWFKPWLAYRKSTQ